MITYEMVMVAEYSSIFGIIKKTGRNHDTQLFDAKDNNFGEIPKIKFMHFNFIDVIGY